MMLFGFFYFLALKGRPSTSHGQRPLFIGHIFSHIYIRLQPWQYHDGQFNTWCNFNYPHIADFPFAN